MLNAKENITIVLVGLVLVVSVFQLFQISSLKENIGSASAGVITGNSVINMDGWTEQEKMMYEHHGTVPAKLQGKKTNSPATGMVGGC